MNNKKGYTLPELLAVIVIIALIATMALTTISQKANNFRTISQSHFEKMIKSSARMYVEDHRNLKDQAKYGNNVKITYTTLKNAKLLPDNMKDLTTYDNIPMENYSVCLKYVNYKYQYTIITSGECN